MVDYSFYRSIFMGDAIPENEFPRLSKKAAYRMAQYRRMYTIDAEHDGPSEYMAICAMAEALYNVELVANGDVGIQSASIGSVSTSYGGAAAKAVDITPAGVERSLFEAARMYLDIYTGVC